MATEKAVGLIDLNTHLADKPAIFFEGDGVHLKNAGYKVMAQEVAKQILKAQAQEDKTMRIDTDSEDNGAQNKRRTE